MVIDDCRQQPTDRGVSEVLAFTLVFGIVISSVVIIYAAGFSSLVDTQETEQLRNAERAFDAASDNFNDVLRYGGITERTGELNLRDGRVSVITDGTTLQIDADGELMNVTTGGIVYEASGRTDTIAYQGGGVFRGDESGSVVLEHPPIRCGEDTAVISILALEGTERSLQSSEVSEVSISENTTATHRQTYDELDNLTITIEDSTHENGWQSTLSRGNWNTTGSTAECEVERATVHVVTVDVEL